MRRLLLLSFLLFCSAPRTGRADIAIVTGSRDNTLFEDAQGDTSNGAGPALFAGRNGQDRSRRALLAFDVAAALPPDAHIDNVVLTLHVSSAPDTTAQVFSVHRVLRHWGEGSSSSSGGGGAPATAGDATWLHAIYPTESWIEPGGDFDATASATQICGDIGFVEWTGPGLVADVSAWLTNPTQSHGWLVRGAETGPRTVRRFDSREASLSEHRPTLTIDYSRPEPVASGRPTWGWLKSFYR